MRFLIWFLLIGGFMGFLPPMLITLGAEAPASLGFCIIRGCYIGILGAALVTAKS